MALGDDSWIGWVHQYRDEITAIGTAIIAAYTIILACIARRPKTHGHSTGPT
jgi:hypothetical protein